MLKTSKSIERAKSSWTPINDQVANRQLFNERMKLLSHWHKAWSESQRRDFITYSLGLCNEEELYYTNFLLKQVTPSECVDFTRILLKSLSIRILSYLEPKSLCRAAQVCWYWNYLASDNSLWQFKCWSIGWQADIHLPMSVLGFWKHFYAQKIHELRKLPLVENLEIEEPPQQVEKIETPPVKKKTISFVKHSTQTKVLAWKSNDKNARDIEKLSKSSEKGKILKSLSA
ncbi:F-box only protein 16 isoform X2 [Oopsacas minuta]|uniref:F-box only protein 16 isoform X2 n=1 Tax=Oopsacas minuta TaxID=111878 RepID=A0AAV7JUK6_9METZ|nr:F-box only protein 16 isoform X2 [Oopsacas minuta]